MPISFNCPKCGGRIQVSWLGPGQMTHCGTCGEGVVVPQDSEPPLIRDKAEPSQASATSRSWIGLIVAGMVPSMFLCLVLVPYVAAILVAVAPLVANPLLGVIVGNSVSRRRFLYGMGVAIAGWFLSVILGASAPPHIAGPDETGWGMFIGVYSMFGLAASPIAGIAARWGPHVEG